MAYIPLWTGLMVDLVYKNISLVTNAYVECYHKQIKEKNLDNDSTNGIADVSSIMIKRNTSLIIEAGLQDVKLKFSLKSLNNTKYKETASNPVAAQSQWHRRKNEYHQRRSIHSELTRTRQMAKNVCIKKEQEEENILNAVNEILNKKTKISGVQFAKQFTNYGHKNKEKLYRIKAKDTGKKRR